MAGDIASEAVGLGVILGVHLSLVVITGYVARDLK